MVNLYGIYEKFIKFLDIKSSNQKNIKKCPNFYLLNNFFIITHIVLSFVFIVFCKNKNLYKNINFFNSFWYKCKKLKIYKRAKTTKVQKIKC